MDIRGFDLMFSKSFDKKSSGGAIKPDPSYQLANELHRQIARKFMRRKVFSTFRDNIWGADLAYMQSLSNTTEELYIYWAQLIYLVNRHGFFL